MCLEAVRKNSALLHYCPEQMLNNIDIALLGKTKRDFSIFNEEIRNNPLVVKHYVEQDPESIHYAGTKYLMNLYNRN